MHMKCKFLFERSGLESEGETALQIKVQWETRKSGGIGRETRVNDKLKLIAQEILVINRSLIRNIVRGKIFLE